MCTDVFFGNRVKATFVSRAFVEEIIYICEKPLFMCCKCGIKLLLLAVCLFISPLQTWKRLTKTSPNPPAVGDKQFE